MESDMKMAFYLLSKRKSVPLTTETFSCETFRTPFGKRPLVTLQIMTAVFWRSDLGHGVAFGAFWGFQNAKMSDGYLISTTTDGCQILHLCSECKSTRRLDFYFHLMLPGICNLWRTLNAIYHVCGCNPHIFVDPKSKEAEFFLWAGFSDSLPSDGSRLCPSGICVPLNPLESGHRKSQRRQIMSC